MFKLVAFALAALLALSTVNALPIVRRDPEGYDSSILENYSDYHARYLALDCQDQHGTQFFDDCCHPMKQGETLENNRLPYCNPDASPSSTLSEPSSSTPASEPSSSPLPDDDGDDDDDGCDDEPSSQGPQPTLTSTPPPEGNETTPTPTPTPSPEPSPSSSDEPAPSPSPTNDSSSDSETHTDADLTWFTQNGVAGACGQVHSDSDFIAALDTSTYGDTSVQSSYCGKTIRITWQGKTVDAVVADACPTCNTPSSVDLSQGAFQALASLDTGLLTGASWVLL